jgi:hypothetical protein
MAADPSELVERLSAIPGRAACTDAERRAARSLAAELRNSGHETRVDTFWVRPSANTIHAAAAALGVVASVISVNHQQLAIALLAATGLLLAEDLAGRPGLARRLTTARATQNVVARSPETAPVCLIVTAAVDTPPTTLLASGPSARAEARVRQALRGHVPGPHGMLVAALAALCAVTALRADGNEGVAIGLLQIVPTTVLILLAAAFAEGAVAVAATGANANASAAAAAVAVYERALAVPLRRVAVDLLLAGAGEPDALGARHELRARRKAGVSARDVIVLHLAPCGAGSPAWWTRDGRVLALRFHADLVALCEGVARDRPELGARPHETRRTSAARVARSYRWPAISVGCVDADGVAPLAGERGDVAAAVDPAAIAAAVEFCLALVRAVDEYLVAQEGGGGGADGG